MLLAEDSPDNRRVIVHHLTRAGLSVATAEDGREAVEAVLEANPTFDAVLMDMQMPVMDGYTAAASLRRSGYPGPIIALTAHAMHDDRERCLASGCSHYLTKPVDPALLIETITRGMLHAEPGEPEDPEMAALIREFEADMKTRVNGLREAMAAGELDLVASLAHQTRGSGRMYGHEELGQAAGVLEDQVRSGAPPDTIAAAIDAFATIVAGWGRSDR